ncbi:MAG: dihydroneopterin aldolase [Proteobacteria bacterium]|nr:dihydroneopterin aldolase [Pseudomonadota bacterium]
MKDILVINGLTVETSLGVYAWEKKIKRKIKLDFEIAVDIQKVASTDDLKSTIDYHALNQQVTEFLSENSFQLIETLAERVAEFVLEKFSVSWLRLSAYKAYAIPTAKEVGVIIERPRA